MLCIDVRVSLEIIEAASGTPSPGSEGAPVVRLARLALVDEADDTAGKTGTVISLDTAGIYHRIAPSGSEELLV